MIGHSCSLILAVALIQSIAFGQRTLEWRDIIELSQPSAPQISPNGQHVAYSLRTANLESNSTNSSYWVVSDGQEPRRILDEPVASAAWTTDSRDLLLRLGRGKQPFWRFTLGNGQLTPLFEHHEPIGGAWWSPDRTRLIFISAPSEPQTNQRKRERDGIRYDETLDGIRSFTRGVWTRPQPASLWIWTQGRMAPERVGVDLAKLGALQAIRWASDGTRAVLEYVPVAAKYTTTTHLAVAELLDRPDPRIRTLVTSDATIRGACLTDDKRQVYFASTGTSGRFYDSTTQIHSIDLSTGKVLPLQTTRPWHFLGNLRCGRDHLLVEYDDRPNSTLFRIDLKSGKVAAVASGTDHLSEWSLTPDLRWAAVISQTLTTPPEIARVDLSTGVAQTLTDLNPVFRSIPMVNGIERSWTNRFGHRSTGFLFLPRDFRPKEKRVPLIVIQYEFSNKFTAQAQWMTSYPVQHFVANGFAVLLHNYPREVGWVPGDFKGARFSQSDNPIASIEAALDGLVKEGVADRQRIGIAGWSFGAYLAELALTQTKLFSVGSAGEGGLNNAGQYWVTGSRAMQDYLDAFFGGPPFGKAGVNYRSIAPALNTDKLTAPLLREYGTDVGVQSLEFYMAAKRNRKPVEQFIYPNANHIFDRPSYRLASMQRNFDWFRFWLQGIEDPDPEKADQYQRWRHFRELAH